MAPRIPRPKLPAALTKVTQLVPALPGPLARARESALTRARRAAVKTLTVGSGIPVVRPAAQLGMRVLFDNLSGRWEQIREHPMYREGFRDCLAYLPRGFRPRRALDSACGTGLATSVLLERWPGLNVIGTDVSPKMVEAAQDLVPGATFQTASVHKLPFQDAAFDLVTSLDGVVDLAEMLRVTHRKGRVLIVYSRGATTPVSRSLDDLATEAWELDARADAHTGGQSHALVVRHKR
jgi:SAM-dependent methyltransferase